MAWAHGAICAGFHTSQTQADNSRGAATGGWQMAAARASGSGSGSGTRFRSVPVSRSQPGLELDRTLDHESRPCSDDTPTPRLSDRSHTRYTRRPFRPTHHRAQRLAPTLTPLSSSSIMMLSHPGSRRVSRRVPRQLVVCRPESAPRTAGARPAVCPRASHKLARAWPQLTGAA